MLPLLNQAVAMTLALCYLLLLLFGAPVAAWLLWRACKDLHRIADALDAGRARELEEYRGQGQRAIDYKPDTERRVANSAFAR